MILLHTTGSCEPHIVQDRLSVVFYARMTMTLTDGLDIHT